MISLLGFILLLLVSGAMSTPGRWVDICADPFFSGSICCRPGTEGTMYGFQFQWLNVEISWAFAQDECRGEDDSSDSTLVMFESYDKMYCIIEWLSSDPFLVTNYHDFAIGLRKTTSASETYLWDTTDDTEAFPSYTFPWASGFPNGEDCTYFDVGFGAPEPGFFKNTRCYDGLWLYPVCQRTKVACHGQFLAEGDTCHMENDCCPSLHPCDNNVNYGQTCGGCIPDGEISRGDYVSCCSGHKEGEYCAPA